MAERCPSTMLITGFTPFDRLAPGGVERVMPNSSQELARIIAGSDEIRRAIATMFGVDRVDVEFLEVNGRWDEIRLWDQAVEEAAAEARLMGVFSLGAGYTGMKQGRAFPKLHRGLLVETEGINRIHAPRMGIDDPRKIDEGMELDARMPHPHAGKFATAVSAAGNADIQIHSLGTDGVGAGTDMCNYVLSRIIGRMNGVAKMNFGGFVHVNAMMSEDWRNALIATPDKANTTRRSMGENVKDKNPALDREEVDLFRERSRVLPPEEAVDLFQTFLREYAKTLNFFQSE